MSKPEILIRLGKRIKELRATHNITQEELSFASGLDRTYISGLERGNRNPSLVGLRRLAMGFGVSVSELLEGVDDKQSNQKRRR